VLWRDVLPDLLHGPRAWIVQPGCIGRTQEPRSLPAPFRVRPKANRDPCTSLFFQDTQLKRGWEASVIIERGENNPKHGRWNDL
jgi:hypothetical protein